VDNRFRGASPGRRVVPVVGRVWAGQPASRAVLRREVTTGKSRESKGRGGETIVNELDVLDDESGELAWQERALCAQTDPEAFFPEQGGSTREAKRVCLSCDVRGECLEYALAHDERFGIWGGLSERERRKLKKRAV
jgi:WhiB family transcriptional regulator, redox-sensing transcriptional regulator